MGSGHACRVADGECLDFELTAVADINPARKQWSDQRFGHRLYGDLSPTERSC
jgi:hypothetical protein